MATSSHQLNQRRAINANPSAGSIGQIHSASDNESGTTSSSTTVQRLRPPRRLKHLKHPYNQQQNRNRTIFSTLLVIGISIWLLVPLVLVKHTNLLKGLGNSQLGIHHTQEPPPPSKLNQTTNKINKLESQIIDMRQLNQDLAFDNPDGGAWKQGWDVPPKPYSKDNPMTIFVVPHSHCDPGWIKTFDEYFQTQTKRILTTVVESLQKNPKRKFIWAEISYFEWWYREQSTSMQQVVKTLLQRNQLEFVTGGWVQPDEANTELYAMEIQLQEGHAWIKETFGAQYIPTFGWSIDPFGYSPTMAYLLEKYGFKAMLIQRVHYAVKKELASKQHLEFMWRQTWDETGDHDIFTHVMPFFSYDIPHTCGPDPSVCCQFDFHRFPKGCPWSEQPKLITEQNVHERSMLLLDQWQKKATLYRSSVVLSPLGDDFRYMQPSEAEAQFSNFEKIFDYINNNVPGVTVQFGTLSDYFHAVMGNFDVPILKGAFFTYADREQDYWSGYFTSRVFDKALDRKLERVLFAADSLGASTKTLQGPRRALSLFQHHDGVTGTAKTHVVQDYAKRMHEAIHQVQEWIRNKVEAIDMGPCWQSDAPRGLSENLCGEAEDVLVYNPLEVSQMCGDVEVDALSTNEVEYPCDLPGPMTSKAGSYKFEKGLMVHPIKESWQMWKVTKGGAYLFFPGTLAQYNVDKAKVTGWVVDAGDWKRSLIEKQFPDEFGNTAHVLDFIYETDLNNANEEWFVRFSSDIKNMGVFHTDLNGFNFDTHHFRADMPIQSQVYPMPTLASIQDGSTRMTIISEHAQGSASLENGSIDVWLDRRLFRDDERGLGQGVMDNVPTRTTLRVVLEYGGFKNDGEFEITPLCRRMWDELNHPLEAFGMLKYASAAAASSKSALIESKKEKANRFGSGVSKLRTLPVKVATVNDATMIVPFVFMVYKRVDYLKEAMATLRASDFDRARVPLIISHDGHVPEMMEYVESLKDEFLVTQLFHEFSCYDHPHSFPGDDPSLNVGYKGDTYGNPRSWQITCCKHHFTWMLKTVFGLDIKADAFLFMEEDYTVGATIYENILTAMDLLTNGVDKESLFAITLDPTDGSSRPDLSTSRKEGWFVKAFVSGPMVLTRSMFLKIQANAIDYCNYDDYNWDWSIVKMMKLGRIPEYVITPTSILVKHIGVEGMHGNSINKVKLKRMERAVIPSDFHGTTYYVFDKPKIPMRSPKAYGGWGHPKDKSHCIEVLTGSAIKGL